MPKKTLLLKMCQFTSLLFCLHVIKHSGCFHAEKPLRKALFYIIPIVFSIFWKVWNKSSHIHTKKIIIIWYCSGLCFARDRSVHARFKIGLKCFFWSLSQYIQTFQSTAVKKSFACRHRLVLSEQTAFYYILYSRNICYIIPT